jgi:Tol biopolymer transport system component
VDVGRMVKVKGKITIYIITSLFMVLVINCSEDIAQYPDNSVEISLEGIAQDSISSGYSWSPDGERIALWATDLDMEVYGLWTVNGDGSSPQLIFNLSDYNDELRGGSLSWSPDGNYIAFVIYQSYPKEYHLMYVSISSGELTEIEVPESPRISSIDYSPDNQWIAYISQQDETPYESDIYRIRIDGTQHTQITSGKKLHCLRWAPDGDWFVSCDYSGDVERIVKISSDGGEQVYLTYNTVFHASYPCWSADGEWVAYSYRQNEPADVWITKSDGSYESYQITNSWPDGEPDVDIYGDVCLDWSSNAKIIFERGLLFKIDYLDGVDFQ